MNQILSVLLFFLDMFNIPSLQQACRKIGHEKKPGNDQNTPLKLGIEDHHKTWTKSYETWATFVLFFYTYLPDNIYVIWVGQV